MELQRIKLDNFKRLFFLKYEILKILLKSIMKCTQIPTLYRYVAFFFKIRTPRIAQKSQFTNLCFITGRAKGVLTRTRYSRFKMRTEAYEGNLPGFKRISW